MKFTLFLTLTLNIYTSIFALRCYTCSVGVDDTDQTCITNPEDLETENAITNCDKKYCISLRIEYLDPKDKVQSLSRTCVDKPVYINKIIEDGTFRSYYVACQEDLCNGGTGKDVSSSSSIGDVGEPIVLLVPGTGSSSALKISFYTIIFMLVIQYLINSK